MEHQDYRQQAMRIANNMLDLNPIYIDTETTGFETRDVVVEIAVLDTDGSVLYESLVKPNKPIPPQVSAVHGITDVTVALSPIWTQIWSEVVKLVAGRVAGFYNAEFDLRMMRQSCGLNGIPWEDPFEDDFCVMELFARFYGDWDPRRNKFRWQNLASAGRYFHLPEPNSHRAKDDALLTKLVLEKMAEGIQH
jgi:DNA polymerase-3 subunit epsilon